LDRREQIVAFAEKHALPAVHFVRQFATAGGLLSCGPSISWMYRQAGEYVGQILKARVPPTCRSCSRPSSSCSISRPPKRSRCPCL
jgi:hypothetical protein